MRGGPKPLIAVVQRRKDNDWVLPNSGATQLPLSTTTTVDLTQARERFALRPSALAQVDKVLER